MTRTITAMKIITISATIVIGIPTSQKLQETILNNMPSARPREIRAGVALWLVQ
jgi:hypothetical protein